jgi:hypothetical protein
MWHMTKTYSGCDAWRNGFSVNAADMLSIIRWACEWSDETFKHVLVIIARRTRGTQTNLRTVEHVLDLMADAGLLLTSREGV